MLKTIFSFETKQLWRTKGMFFAIVLFTFIGFYALLQGKSVYDFKQQSITKRMKVVKDDENEIRAILDTMRFVGKRSDGGVQAPYSLEWQLGAVVAKNITPLSILSIGQSDIYTPLMSVHFDRQFFKNEFIEFQNPEQLFVGNLDISFFILYLVPLLFIAMAYNVQSDDKETGVYPLLKIQASSMKLLIYKRLFIRWLFALIPTFILCFFSFLTLKSLPNFSGSSFVIWWMVALLYAAFWLILVAVIQHFKFSSLINAVVLAGVWVLVLIAIPGLLNTWFSYKFPAIDKTAIVEYRDIDFKGYDKPFVEHQKIVFAQYPQWKKGFVYADSSYFKSFANALTNLEKEKEMHSNILKNSELQISAEKNSFCTNPVGGVMRAFTTLSQSTLSDQQNFEKATLNLRERKARYLYENYLTKPYFTKKDFESMPKINLPNAENDWKIYLFPLFALMCLGLIGLGFMGRNGI